MNISNSHIQDKKYQNLLKIFNDKFKNVDNKIVFEFYKNLYGNGAIFTKKDNIDFISKKQTVGELFDLSEKFYTNKTEFEKLRNMYPEIDSNLKNYYILLKDIELLNK